MARILIVDDDPATREAIGAVAERSGHTCEGASSVREAMHKARSMEFELVFLDVRLPDGDGCAVDLVLQQRCGQHRLPALQDSAALMRA